jgi:hypothetical protein
MADASRPVETRSRSPRWPLPVSGGKENAMPTSKPIAAVTQIEAGIDAQAAPCSDVRAPVNFRNSRKTPLSASLPGLPTVSH